MTRPAGVVAGCLVVLGCGRQLPTVTLPAPASAPPGLRHDGLLAGFGRADITPPPGVGPAGNGFEAFQSDGYHHRLYARAMVLEGTNGQRIAYLVADLPHLSAVLHRLTAARIAAATGIGADRLIVSATHTHSAPANYYEAELYNQQSGPFPGYDRAMVEFVVAGFVKAVQAAVADLLPARAAWISMSVPDLTMNRSYGAFKLNTRYALPLPPAPSRLNAVANTWTLFRVDRCDRSWANCEPRGAFSILPIHGTGLPPANRLLDGDIHALVARGLERYIESRNSSLGSSDPGDCAPVPAEGVPASVGDGRGCSFASAAVHVFANGTEGDVAPRHLPGSRCGEEPQGYDALEARPRLRRARRPEGPRTPAALEEWALPPGTTYQSCLAIARRSVNRLGDQLVAWAIRLFDAAGPLTSRIEIERAFITEDLRSLPLASVLCEPLTGTANYAGADDVRTRLNRWHILGFPAGTEEGRSGIDRDNKGCDGPKRVGVAPLQKLLRRDYGLPRFAQFSVVRIGDGLIGAAPFEITSEAGARMVEGMGTVAPAGTREIGIVGLANGYFQYLVTAEEYAAQEYEGASTLYGPNTAAVVQDQLVTLTRSLAAGAPVVRLDSIDAVPGPERSFFPPRTRGPRPWKIQRRVVSLACETITLPADPVTGGPRPALRFRGRWVDAHPGLLVPADGQVIEIQRETPGGAFQPVAWDDGDQSSHPERRVEILAVGRVSWGYLWEVDWISERLRSGERYRLTLTERSVPGVPVPFPPVPWPGAPLPPNVPVTRCP